MEFTGRPLEKQLGVGWTEGIHKDDFAEIIRKRMEAFKHKEPFVTTYRLQDRHGVYRLVVDSGNPRYNAQGEFEGYSGACVLAGNGGNGPTEGDS